MLTITIRDETTSGSVTHESPLVLPAEAMTVAELIRERIYQEVQDYNRGKREAQFRGLVQPGSHEQALRLPTTDARPVRLREIDWKDQYAKATAAFEKNGFLLLIGDEQAQRLDQKFTLTPGSNVSFLKLTPLVGG